MPKSLQEYLEEERTRVTSNCVACGKCIKQCGIIEHTELENTPAKDVQRKTLDFLKIGTIDKDVYIKAFACMECYRCVKNMCPLGLNPLLINEIVKWEYRRKNIVPIPYTDPKDHFAKQRILASIQVSLEEYKRIFATSQKEHSKIVFFPGCNVYLQPDKLLSALDIMDLIGGEYAFVSGMDFCCGNVYLEAGDVDKGWEASQELMQKISSYNPETVIFWCPTCQCRFDMTLSKLSDFPFEIISFPQYLTRHLDKLKFSEQTDKTVTLHEACKAAYTGLDTVSIREVLNAIPGVRLKEMPRSGLNTACCGSSAMDFFSDSMEKMRDLRLTEAEETGADCLIDICQTCHNIFVKEESNHTFEITSYVSLIAKALGIGREDKFKKYKKWADAQRIAKDAAAYIAQSCYSYEEIMKIINSFFI